MRPRVQLLSETSVRSRLTISSQYSRRAYQLFELKATIASKQAALGLTVLRDKDARIFVHELAVAAALSLEEKSTISGNSLSLGSLQKVTMRQFGKIKIAALSQRFLSYSLTHGQALSCVAIGFHERVPRARSPMLPTIVLVYANDKLGARR